MEDQAMNEEIDNEEEVKNLPLQRYHDMLQSWLDFNDRIINEANRPNINPIVERLNFLAIADSNLDEFIRTKYSSNKGQGLRKRILSQTSKIENTFDSIVSELQESFGITITTVDSLKDNPKMMDKIKKTFEDEIYPLIQPMVLKDELPIPDMQDGGFFMVTKIDTDSGFKEFSGIIKMPENKLVKLKDKTFVRMDDIIEWYVQKFYKGKTIAWNKQFRVFRKISTLSVSSTSNYLKTIKNELDARTKAEVIMTDVSDNINGLEELLGDTKKRRRKYPSGFSFLKDAKDLFNAEDTDMVYDKFRPRIPAAFQSQDIFKSISERDIIVHFPYESFELSTIKFLEAASIDPQVKVIKQTLYRVAHDSPLIKALVNASKQGKQVVVLLELKAKMDEEHNLVLVDILKKAGCSIIFGPIQMKTHGKTTLVIREENGKLQKYCNISTGNFNDKTAKVYEDISYFVKETNKFSVGEDLCDLFNMLGGCSDMRSTNVLAIAPDTFRPRMVDEINMCISSKLTHPEEPTEIKMKCNSFTDEKIAEKLYEASAAGVKVTLFIRGMCIIKAKVPGLSDNISVTSIVGRFLEHSRVYEFIYGKPSKNPEKDNSEGKLEYSIYIGSGDMMPRNLDYRVEVITPIRTKPLKAELHEMLLDYQKDNYGAYIMNSDGTYSPPLIDTNPDLKEEEKFSVQSNYCKKYKKIEKSFMKS